MDNKMICRAYQLCSALLLRIKPVEKQIKIKGKGRLADAAELFKTQGVGKVEIITTAGTVKRGTLNALEKRLSELGIAYTVFDGVRSDPDIECIEEAAKLFRREGCEAIIAVGGGSAMDCAKIAAARAVCPHKGVREMKGLLRIHKKLPFLAAVPTTAGTGSEITAAAVVTDRKSNYKFTVMDFCIVPDAAILDPVLTAGLPAGITAETGMDAFTHAIEAYLNKFSSGKINDYAMKAMKLIDGNIEKAVSDGSDIKARENMLLGSYYAGIAFTNGYVGYVHAIAHGLGGLYHIPHGRACAMVLPVVLEGYGNAIAAPMARIAQELCIGEEGSSREMLCSALIEHIRLRNKRMGIPDGIELLKREDIPEIANRAASEANPGYPVPVIWNSSRLAEAIEKLLQ